MQSYNIVAVYDRKKVAEKKGIASIDIRITLSRTERKFIKFGDCSPKDWFKISKSLKLKDEIERIKEIIETMITAGEELTIPVLNEHLGLNSAPKEQIRPTSNFLHWLRDEIAKQKLRPNTLRGKTVALEAITKFGKIKRFSDLTPANIYAFDDYLRKNHPDAADITIFAYHKRLRPYIKHAFQLSLIAEDPYDRCELKHGKSKLRKPLCEDELVILRKTECTPKVGKVRDLFVFSAYTGLAYCDVMEFDFKTMTEKKGELYYIDGERIKSGSDFYTPILPPAMEILKKYNYKLPKISNQKANDYLGLLKEAAKLNKPLTFHIARHSFATLALEHDIPIDKLARMMGHKSVRTTQIYAKVMKKSLINHGADFAKSLK